jgi:crossover junction endodeoxyribonuclease RuvC
MDVVADLWFKRHALVDRCDDELCQLDGTGYQYHFQQLLRSCGHDGAAVYTAILSRPTRALIASYLAFPVFCFCNRAIVGTVACVGITLQQFHEMTARVSGRKPRVASPVIEPSPIRNNGRHTVILGLDPSLRGTGFGVIEIGKAPPRALAHGTISSSAAWPHSRCLANISQSIRNVLRKYQPTVCAVEGLFFAQNLKTAIVMGEARGAALATIAEAGLEIYEIAPRKVKQAIVGYGAAQKLAVAKMVQRMLQLPEPPAADAADALALALAHAQEQGRYSLTAPKRI